MKRIRKWRNRFIDGIHKTRCLQCNIPIEEFVSLCDKCLSKEFEKMEHGDPSGYLYANEMYLKLKEVED